MAAGERSLLYVSRKTFLPDAEDVMLGDIVAVAIERNAALGVTGALVSTAAHFAQILEGPGDALDALMDSIYRDGRHADVTMLREWPITRRAFPKWSLAYAGRSSYMSGHLDRLLVAEVDDAPGRVDRVLTLIGGLATA